MPPKELNYSSRMNTSPVPSCPEAGEGRFCTTNVIKTRKSNNEQGESVGRGDGLIDVGNDVDKIQNWFAYLSAKCDVNFMVSKSATAKERVGLSISGQGIKQGDETQFICH